MTDKEQDLRSYGRFDAGTSQIYRPTNIAQVKQVFEIARESGRRVAIRGGGHSFDAQALHNNDSGTQIILSTEAFEPERIEFDLKEPENVTVGCGVRWRHFVTKAIDHARRNNAPLYLPGSIQTGGDATVGGTLAADCLSRFSGTMGKESRWIHSFRILTPNADNPVDVSAESDPDLFHAVIGGFGYLGFVTDITYKLVRADRHFLEHGDTYKRLCANTKIRTYGSLCDLIQKQRQLLEGVTKYPNGVSAEWFGGSLANPCRIHGAVCESWFAKPSFPKRFGFPLYHKLHSRVRYWAEIWVRSRLGDAIVDWVLYLWAILGRRFEDPVEDYLFFMDGDTAARKKFERLHHPQLFPVVQQTFVVPIEKTESFARNCIRKTKERGLRATESDMLYVLEDECMMSANYRLSGFALSLAFEQPTDDDGPPQRVTDLLRELSRDCLEAGGRIHLPKNSHVDKDVFRAMFKGQIERFETIKRHYDPDLLLQNSFSDRLFEFQVPPIPTDGALCSARGGN